MYAFYPISVKKSRVIFTVIPTLGNQTESKNFPYNLFIFPKFQISVELSIRIMYNETG